MLVMTLHGGDRNIHLVALMCLALLLMLLTVMMITRQRQTLRQPCYCKEACRSPEA